MAAPRCSTTSWRASLSLPRSRSHRPWQSDRRILRLSSRTATGLLSGRCHPIALPAASRAAPGLRCAPLLAGRRPPLTPPGAMAVAGQRSDAFLWPLAGPASIVGGGSPYWSRSDSPLEITLQQDGRRRRRRPLRGCGRAGRGRGSVRDCVRDRGRPSLLARPAHGWPGRSRRLRERSVTRRRRGPGGSHPRRPGGA